MLPTNRIALGRLQSLLPIVLGVSAFLLVVGPRVLRPTNIGWLASGDPAQHYLGWSFFRNSDWSFPLGLNPNYGLELSGGLIFTDSIPLFALLFKTVSPLLPEPFQYFGIWVLLCFVLQAWFAWKLVSLFAENITIRILGTGLLVFSPPMIWRLHGHMSLVGHFVILAALYLLFRQHQEKRILAWSVALSVAAMVHAYLLAMVLALWVVGLAQNLLARRQRSALAALEFVTVAAVTVTVCWQVGYFSVEGGLGVFGGYGFYRMNFLSPVDSSGWSYILRDIPEGKGEYEGFNFLGLGVMFLAIVVVPILLRGDGMLRETVRQNAFLSILLVGLFFYSISNVIGIGSFEFRLFELPPVLRDLTAAFRASGRFFWPAFYLLVLFLVLVVVRGYEPRVATFLLGIALIIQVVDTHAGWRGLRGKLMARPVSTWVSPLTAPFWDQAGQRYSKVRLLMPQYSWGHWVSVGDFAARHRMATDIVHLARQSPAMLRVATDLAATATSDGNYELDTLYVVDDRARAAALLKLDSSRDLATEVDGFTVIAPGWKTCARCAMFGRELRLEDFVPHLMIGDRIDFTKKGNGMPYLVRGWSYAGDAGTWSDGACASMLIPVLGRAPNAIEIEGNALVSHRHPKQGILVKLNGRLVKTVSIVSADQVRLEIPVSDEIQMGDWDGQLVLDIEFKDAARPKDIGINEDDRLLAFHLTSATLR